MRWMRRLLLLLAAGAVAVLWMTARARSAAGPVAAPDDSVISFRVEFGVSDAEPAAWDGTLSAANGEVTGLRNWRPRAGDQIHGKTGWSLATRKGQTFRYRPWEQERLTNPPSYLLIPGIIVDVKASPGARVSFRTRQGDFQLVTRELQPGRPLSFLGGRVVVDRTPAAQLLSTPEYQNDFASIVGGPGGEVWTAWVAYRNQASEVLARRFDGAAWGPLSESPRSPAIFFW